MKKILTFLVSVLLTLSTYGQEKISLVKSSTPTQVGDTLVVDIKYQGSAGTAKLTQFDFQYNNKLLSLKDRTWKLTSTSAQKAYNSWNGYKWGNNTATTDIDGQYSDYVAGSTVYGSNADWSVERVTIQDVTAFANNDEWIQYRFTIKDKANTNYSNYSDLINLNWGYLKESDGTAVAVDGEVNGGTSLSLSGIQGGDAGNVTLNILTNIIDSNIGDGTHFTYKIYNKSDIGSGNQPNQGATVVAEGTYDASGQAIVTGLENDVEYFVWNWVDQSKDYMDNVVTVSDLALVFAEAIGAGSTPNGTSTTFDYYIQTFLANVYHDEAFDGKIDFSDSYEILAYLQGVTSSNTPYITKKGLAYQTGGNESTFGTVDDNGSYFAGIDATFKPTDSNKTFNFVHALMGDVNFSHSWEPDTQGTTIPETQQSAMASSMRVSMAAGQKYQSETANIDLVSEIVDGKVHFSINSQVEGMIGSQFNIEYNTNILTLENVIFDTGNEMTNFSNIIEEGKVRIGSFDQNFSQVVKTGTPYKLVFTPNEEIQNTSGLITFRVKEGVKSDGTQITFNIQ
jgi:hypothetical protein